jgi:DNA replication protein DnaC
VQNSRLAGTGVWRSALTDDLCSTCIGALEILRQKEQSALAFRTALIHLLGGEKHFREYTFDRFAVTSGNRLAFERSKGFDPATDNLYLWGHCGVGKTHLAWATARRRFETLSVVIVRCYQLSRRVRMKEPEQEQAAIDEFASADVLVLDDLGAGADTAFSRQLLQEILDVRIAHDRNGLLVTSKFSLDQLASKFGDDSIPSRLSGLCQIIAISGVDRRLTRKPDDP